MKVRLNGKPKDAKYLTPGKVYDVLESGHDLHRIGLHIQDDEGDTIHISLGGPYPCAHARPATWERVE